MGVKFHYLLYMKGLSSQGFGFDPRLIHVRFLVDKVALEQVFLQIFRFSPVNTIPPTLLTNISFIYYRRCISLPKGSVVKQDK
jgi:hypothetical protein